MNPRPLICIAILLATCTLPAAAAPDDLRIRQLMDDINELKQMVRAQAQRIDRLEAELASRSVATGAPPWNTPSSAPGTTVPESARWLSPETWDRVRAGMTEQDMLAILGLPTSVRGGPGSSDKTLFYTVQLGPSGFLSGRVVVTDQRVREVEKPALR